MSTPTSFSDGDGTITVPSDAQFGDNPWWEQIGAALNPAPTTPALGSQQQQDAYTRLLAIFTEYGLESLAPVIRDYIIQGYSSDTIALMLRETDAYKQRFPAMDELSKTGRAIDEATYVGYERTARNLETQYGLPKGYIENPDTIKNLLTNNVTPEDLTARVQINAAATKDASPELRRALTDYYGLDPDGALLAYYLDPDRAVTELERQVGVAKIGAAGSRQGFSLTEAQANVLRQRGVTQDQADAGFSQAAAQRGLTAGVDSVSQQDTVDAAFGDTEAALRVRRASQARQARFGGGGGAVEGQSGVAGLGDSRSR